MRQLIIVVIAVALVIILWLGFYFFSHQKGIMFATDKKFLINRINLANRDLQEELIFFLARQLGIYEGNFQIVDVVNLEAREMTGTDYLLITLRAPDGKLCQIVISRKSLPWAKWEIRTETYKLIESSADKTIFLDNPGSWMKELGVTAEDVRQYYRAHPEAIMKGEEAFFDQETGSPRLPADWDKTVKTQTQYKLSINKNEPARFVPGMKVEQADAFWQPDYPSDYLGAGYRSYLYEKVKDNN